MPFAVTMAGETPVAAVSPPATPGRTAQDARMENAAHQFEASLIAELFKPLAKDPLFSGGSGDDTAEAAGSEGDGESGPLGSFAMEAMAREVSDRGGFGIARRLIEHFEKSERKADGSAALHSSSLLLRR